MSTITWPTYLPYPQRSGHQYTPADLVLRTQMEGGPDRTRQKYSAGPSQFAISWVLTREQWFMFEGFFAYDLAQGNNEFYLPVSIGMGATQLRAKFIGAPTYDASVSPNHANVTATVQIVEPYYMDATTWSVIKTDYGSDPTLYLAFLSRLDTFVNADLDNSTAW